MKKYLLWIASILIFFIVLIIIVIVKIDDTFDDLEKDPSIKQFMSSIDKDEDGIDDQTDILENTKKYISTKPHYKSKYYETGYPNDQYGVCTDVVAFGLKGAGYDLMILVNEDIINHREEYNIETIDKNIDFRRVKNLKIFFDNNAISKTLDLKKVDEWQGGDIVLFEKHIGIISDRRNKKGIPYVIHHANPYQRKYEQDILKKYKVVGHYRMSE